MCYFMFRCFVLFFVVIVCFFFFFFFQAEDGIRDIGVTGVQTCALPICVGVWRPLMRVASDSQNATQDREIRPKTISLTQKRARSGPPDSAEFSETVDRKSVV